MPTCYIRRFRILLLLATLAFDVQLGVARAVELQTPDTPRILLLVSAPAIWYGLEAAVDCLIIRSISESSTGTQGTEVRTEGRTEGYTEGRT